MKEPYLAEGEYNLQLRIFAVSLLIACITFNFFISSASSTTFDSWANVEVISFDGNNIFLNLKIFSTGKHVSESMWIIGETYPGMEIGRAISDIVFDEPKNVTTFTYSYSYNITEYSAVPKIFGFLSFPWDEHRIALYINSQFDLKFDQKRWNCKLPSENYNGEFRITREPTEIQPLRYKLFLEIKHPPNFINGVAWFVYGIIISISTLTAINTVMIILIALGKKSHDLIRTLIPISTGIVFFIPVFEVRLYALKSPLSLVFPDILLIIIILWNISIVIVATLITWRASKKPRKPILKYAS